MIQSLRHFPALKCARAALMGFALAALAPSALALKVPQYTLTYEVVVRNLVAGELVINVAEDTAGNVTIRGETFPNMLAQSFGDGKVVEIISYQRVNENLRLKSVKEIKGEDGSQVKESKVNWKNKTIRIGDRVIAFDQGTQMDAYTLPFLRVLGLDRAGENSSTTVVSAKKIRDYVYENPANEALKIGQSTYEATRYTKYKDHDKGRKISIWVSKSAPVMPLKIEVMRKGKRHSWVSLTDIKYQ